MIELILNMCVVLINVDKYRWIKYFFKLKDLLIGLRGKI